MSSSDMDETNPVSGEETFMKSGKIPIPAETLPFHVIPLGVTFPLRYRALADIMSSMSPPTSSMSSYTVAPTSKPFIPQIHNVSVTSVPTVVIVCVASLAPTVSAVAASSVVTTVAGPSVGPTSGGSSTSTSGVVNPTNSVPPSSDSISVGWIYD